MKRRSSQAINRLERHLGDTCFNRERWNNCRRWALDLRTIALCHQRRGNNGSPSFSAAKRRTERTIRRRNEVTMEAHTSKLELSPGIRVYPPLFNGIYYTHVEARERELSHFHNAAAITRNKWRPGFMKICNSKGTNVFAALLRENGNKINKLNAGFRGEQELSVNRNGVTGYYRFTSMISPLSFKFRPQTELSAIKVGNLRGRRRYSNTMK